MTTTATTTPHTTQQLSFITIAYIHLHISCDACIFTISYIFLLLTYCQIHPCRYVCKFYEIYSGVLLSFRVSFSPPGSGSRTKMNLRWLSCSLYECVANTINMKKGEYKFQGRPEKKPMVKCRCMYKA